MVDDEVYQGQSQDFMFIEITTERAQHMTDHCLIPGGSPLDVSNTQPEIAAVPTTIAGNFQPYFCLGGKTLWISPYLERGGSTSTFITLCGKFLYEGICRGRLTGRCSNFQNCGLHINNILTTINFYFIAKNIYVNSRLRKQG